MPTGWGNFWHANFGEYIFMGCLLIVIVNYYPKNQVERRQGKLKGYILSNATSGQDVI